MRLSLTTHLPAPPERVWEEVQTSRLLEHVAAPVVRFRPASPSELPPIWSDGSYEVRMLLVGLLPAGKQLIRISRSSDGRAHTLRDDGVGQLAETWDHRIFVQPSPDGGTDYTDVLYVHAGALTPFVWAFAHFFYRHRQRRWRALVSRGFDYGS